MVRSLTHGISRLADDHRAFEAAEKHFNPNFVQTDVVKQRQWALASGKGFYTYPHVDGSGLCTWVYLTEGTKLWSYLRPKSREENDPSDKLVSGDAESRKRKRTPLDSFKLSKVYEQYQAMADCTHEHEDAPVKIPELADTHNLLLEPGVLL